ncbi:MAG: RloB domain-containing protein [Saprospiraceae bacterium]|nr:RloB domain-containing protein [Saprospiraceae bacterium]
MSRRKATQRYSVLIVCEGGHTEPNYFKGIREEVIAQGLWTEGIEITIRPKPPLDEEDTPAPSRHKKARARRQLKAGIETVPVPDVEEEYKAYPTRFVREAQKGLEDGAFDEAWAVFDKDYHPRHAEAFQLAAMPVNGKYAQIAFSSISFEHWVLLHFEKNAAAFLKSECKNPSKAVIHCGTGGHSEDCYGAKCVAGYMRACGYLPDYSKQANIDLFSALKISTHQAVENASWLRSKVSGVPVFTLNPYTDVDILVARLLKLENQYLWLKPNTFWANEDIHIAFGEISDSQMQMTVSNKKDVAIAFHKAIEVLSNGEVLDQQSLRTGIIAPRESYSVLVQIPPDHGRLPNCEVRIVLDDGFVLVVEMS